MCSCARWTRLVTSVATAALLLVAAQTAWAAKLIAEEDAGGASVNASGVNVEISDELAHEGQTSLKLTATLGGGTGAHGGEVAIYPPPGASWLGDRLVFWCYPTDAPLLGVAVWDERLTAFSLALTSNELTVGQWNRVEIAFSDIKSFTGPGRQFGAISAVKLLAQQSWDQARRYYTRAGEYTWYIDELHVEGTGPVPIDAALVKERRQPLTEAPGEGGLQWLPVGNVTAEPDGDTVKDGQASVRVTASVQQLEGDASGGHMNVFPPPGASWTGDRLTFWCLPREAPVLVLSVRDRDYTELSYSVPPETLQVGTWSRVEVPFADAKRVADGADGVLSEISSVTFVFSALVDRDRQYIKAPGTYAWLLDGLKVEGQPAPAPAALQPVSVPDLGLDGTWTATGNCRAEPVADPVADGTGSARLAFRLDEATGAGGEAVFQPADGKPWPSTGIRFSCRPQTGRFITVTGTDSDGTQVMWALYSPDVTPGIWNTVHLTAATMHQFGRGDAMFDNLATLSFSVSGQLDPERHVFPRDTDLVWYFDSFELTGEGPTPLVPSQAGRGNIVDDSGDRLAWRPQMRASADVSNEVVHEGECSIKLSLPPRVTGQSDWGHVSASWPEATPADGVVMWVYPAQPGPFRVWLSDADNHTADWEIAETDLRPEEWNQLTLRLQDAVIHDRAQWAEPLAPDAFGSSRRILLSLNAVVPEGNTETYVWYVDSVALIPKGQP